MEILLVDERGENGHTTQLFLATLTALPPVQHLRDLIASLSCHGPMASLHREPERLV